MNMKAAAIKEIAAAFVLRDLGDRASRWSRLPVVPPPG
jgi:hypothetical protein